MDLLVHVIAGVLAVFGAVITLAVGVALLEGAMRLADWLISRLDGMMRQ